MKHAQYGEFKNRIRYREVTPPSRLAYVHDAGIDNDPAAISVAKANARLNKIRGVSFQLGDVYKWNSVQEINVITANLYSNLLIEILPNLSSGAWLILSGILRSQTNWFAR